MPKLSKEQKESVRRDRGSMSINDLVGKYGVSRATIHRVLAETEVRVPVVEEVNPDFQEFEDVLAGRERKPEPAKETAEEKKDPVADKAMEQLASSLFKQGLDGEEVVQTSPVRVEDGIEKTAVIQRILLNLDNFAPLFHFIHNRNEFVASLPHKSVDELKGILQTMEQTRTTLNLANQFKNTFLMVGKATEVLAPRVIGLKTDGFVENLMSQRQELDMIFRELAIDYAPRFTFQSRPEVRLAMLYGMTLLQVDNNNRIKDFVKERQEAEVPEATKEAFGDL